MNVMNEPNVDLMDRCKPLARWWHALRRSRSFTGLRAGAHWHCECGIRYRQSWAFRSKLSLMMQATAVEKGVIIPLRRRGKR